MAASLAVLRCPIRRAFLKINNVQEAKFAFYSGALAKDIKQNDIVPISNGNYTENIDYPPIKPKYPPGKWGDMEPSYAWLWQKVIDDLWQISDIKERQKCITHNPKSYIDVNPYSDHPNYFDFVRYATKTNVLSWSELFSTSTTYKEQPNMDDNLIEKMKGIIIDHILIEQESVEREYSNKIDPVLVEKRQSASVLRSIFETLMTQLSGKVSHLRTCQYDEDVIVRAVWDRHGIERKRMHRLGPRHYKVDEVLDQSITSSCLFDGMIRTPFPLPQVHPSSHGLSVESEKPVLDYKFKCYGVQKIPGYKPRQILAGHVLGDPCEYGTLGFLLTNKDRNLDKEFGSQVAQRCRLGRGLTSTFTWLAAQAYNQGFSGYIDMTYPLVSQTVMSDGRNCSFLVCQLNTLELWKCDDANKKVNLCWHTDEMPLYECIENGQVKGFNDEVLHTLVNLFLQEPVDRGYDMKPTISDKDTRDLPHQKADFIPEKVDQVVVKEEEQFIV